MGDKQTQRNSQFILGLLTKLELYEKFIEEKLPAATVRAVELRLTDLESLWVKFKKCLPPYDLVDTTQITQQILEQIEELYFEIQPALVDRIQELRINALKTNDVKLDEPKLNFKLPEIALDSFNGDFMHWKSFIGTFDSLIHSNASLPDLSKFQYLKKAVKGIAAQTIESLDFTEKNYQVARELLKNRFEKENLICERHIKELFSFKNLDRPCPKRLLELVDHFNSHMRSLATLGRPVNHWDDLLVFMMVSKLDAETRSRWVDDSPSERLATVEDFHNFLRARAHKLESLPKTTSSTPNVAKQSPKPTSRSTRPSTSLNATKSQKPVYQCHHCQQTGHTIIRCHKFLTLPVADRHKFACEAKLCNNCLRPNHDVDACPVTDRCRFCNQAHHSLLHDATTTQNPSPTSIESMLSVSTPSSERSEAKPKPISTFVYLATALINVLNRDGQVVTGRALLDSGSQINFVSSSFAARLRLNCSPSSTIIQGIGLQTISSTSTASITLQSRESNYSTTLKVHILPKLTDYQPTFEVKDIKKWAIPCNINLADPDFYKQMPIDILLGADIYYDLLSIGQIKLSKYLPILQNTVFGWIVSGRCDLIHQKNPVCHLATGEEAIISTQIERFWKIEDISEPKPSLDEEDECEKHFSKFTSRDIHGRFVVKLPFSCDPTSLGDSKTMALRRHHYLEKRLSKSPDLRASYSAFMADYINLNHMVPVKLNAVPSPNFFLPHHSILKPDSSTTKLRVVFDGSAKTSSGKSLNNILRVGPTVQNDLFTILLRFRSHKYAFSADIAKMYRQVRVHEDDQQFQCILWRNSPHEDLQTYKLTTVTYGTSCAPFLATRCLVQLSKDHASEWPVASDSILKDIYVDDLLTGAQTDTEARTLKSDIEKILETSGMQLRKWCSNSPDIIQDVPLDHQEKFLNIDDNNMIKTLGILWQPTADVFTFSINLPDTSTVTKRSIFSQIARIFDPLGLLAPVVVIGKLLIQSLWQLQLNWDQAVPQHLYTEWIRFRESLYLLNNFSIERYLFSPGQTSAIQIHGFCDASERAYGAVLYVRSVTTEGEVLVRILCSKSRVAPLKTVTLPRLELCAANLLASLTNSILPNLNFQPNQIFYWSDSTITLHWIKSSPTRWKSFVANRVTAIQKLSDPDSWNHVPTKQNPADMASRGLSPDKFVQNLLWTNGPKFLKFNNNLWPSQPYHFRCAPSDESRMSVNHARVHSPDDVYADISSNRDFMSLQRVISYILRFKRTPRYRGKIEEEELSRAHTTIIKHIQLLCFPEEVNGLSKEDYRVKNPILKSLSLFLDSNNIIRVGGRLHHSNIPYESKHQILLPANHDFTLTVLMFYHEKLYHAGPQSLLAAVREFYWPIHGKRLCTKVFRECITCFRVRPTVVPQKLGNLPTDRITTAPPFYSVAVDYCGPFFVHYRIRGKQPTKTYMCVFVCTVTKAVHLDLASDLSTSSFLGVLKRFVASRGKPHKILSDNATNFVGANSTLNELYHLVSSDDLKDAINDFCKPNKIKWRFTPPNSPNFGGLHEAGVKLAKFHLRRTIGKSNLTYEQLLTSVKDVEAILNSRPITELSNSPDDLDCLTPGHFLIGRRLTSLPIPELQERPPLDTWKQIDQIKGHFWKRWSTEYLRAQQKRYQWANPTKNISVGDLVILVDDNLPPMKWKLGRITETFPGEDGLVRVVKVKTSTGEYKRGITRICQLPSSVETGITFQPREDDELPDK